MIIKYLMYFFPLNFQLILKNYQLNQFTRIDMLDLNDYLKHSFFRYYYLPF